VKTVNGKKNFRWVLLRHTFAPGDVGGFHFDFLLEDKEYCRTWRLSAIPLLDGPYVESLHIPPHNLYWLNIKEKVVSGNRGIATRVKKGIFWESLPSIEDKLLKLPLIWDDVEVNLSIDERGCRIFS
tara:strand:- start:94 stop:474 length:381 start_codon:yes stop_codon:yes gene_type:complete